MDDGNHYFVLSKFKNIFILLKRIKWDRENLCPINYFSCLEKLGIEFEITKKI